MACLACRGKRWCDRCHPHVTDSAAPAADTTAELVVALNRIRETLGHDPEAAHGAADKALLEYIGDEKVEEAFKSLVTWYA